MTIKEDKEELITIELPLKVWEQIASACINVADWDIVNEQIKKDLRKTYYQIKKAIR